MSLTGNCLIFIGSSSSRQNLFVPTKVFIFLVVFIRQPKRNLLESNFILLNQLKEICITKKKHSVSHDHEHIVQARSATTNLPAVFLSLLVDLIPPYKSSIQSEPLDSLTNQHS
jgi:hypothetical protein